MMTKFRFWPQAICGLALAAAGGLPLRAQQGLGVDDFSLGPIAVHDHVNLDYHLKIVNDPFPHETKEEYAYDGVDLGAALGWHWRRQHFLTTLRLTPASRDHLAYDQDTDFEGTTDFTHGNQGHTRARTFGVGQRLPLLQLGGHGRITYDFSFLRQWARYNQVETYDLNSNPALPSTLTQRVISEQAILYEYKSSLGWDYQRPAGSWLLQSNLELTPMASENLHNYIPVVLAATSTTTFGGGGSVGVSHALGCWQVRLSGEGAWLHAWDSNMAFRRETFAARLEFLIPRH